MKPSKTFLSYLLVGLTFITSSALAVQPTNTNGIVGTWVNTNSNTSGITKFSVSGFPGFTFFKSWGACHPTDCVHTTVTAYPHSSSVGSNTAIGFYAYRNSNFKYTRFVAQRVGQYIRLTSLSTFAPGDNRKNYMKTEYFKKM
jgi:hypothetical protein